MLVSVPTARNKEQSARCTFVKRKVARKLHFYFDSASAFWHFMISRKNYYPLHVYFCLHIFLIHQHIRIFLLQNTTSYPVPPIFHASHFSPHKNSMLTIFFSSKYRNRRNKPFIALIHQFLATLLFQFYFFDFFQLLDRKFVWQFNH